MSMTSSEPRVLNDRVLDVLREAVGRRTSARSLSEQLGHSHNYVRRLFSGEIPLQMETLQDILQRLELPAQLFFDQVFEGLSVADPVAVLRFYREGDGLPRDPFFGEVGPRFEAAFARPVDPHAEVDGWDDELEQLEERRFEDREGAKLALEDLIQTILGQCEMAEDDVPSGYFAGLARACSIWAVIQRVSGYRDNSCDMYVLAFRCLRRADSHLQAAAECYQKAAYLLRDLDAMRAGLFFLRRSGDLFLRTGDVCGLGKVLVDSGKLLIEVDEFEEAKIEFQASLNLLKEDSVRHRATAHAALARIFDEEDRLGDAIEQIRRACELYSMHRDIVAAQITVLRGRIARKLDLRDEAESAFLEAIDVYENAGHPGYVLFAGLEYAGLLLATGRTRKLAALADRMFAMGKYFRKNRLIDGALMEFVRMAKWGELTEDLLESTRKRLEATSSSLRL